MKRQQGLGTSGGEGPPQPIFQGYCVVLSLGNVNYESKRAIRTKIVARGGLVTYVINNKCKFVVDSKPVKDISKTWNWRLAQKYGIPVMPPHYIDICILKGKVLSPATYGQHLLSSYAQQASQQFEKGAISCSTLPRTDFCTPAKFMDADGKGVKNVKVWDYETQDGPQFHAQDYKIVKSTLLKSEPHANGEMSFCLIEVQTRDHRKDPQPSEDEGPEQGPTDAPPRYCIFTHSGLLKDRALVVRKPSVKKPGGAPMTCRYTDNSEEAWSIYNFLCRIYATPPHSLTKWDPRKPLPPALMPSSKFREKAQGLWIPSATLTSDAVLEMVGNLSAETSRYLTDHIGIDLHKIYRSKITKAKSYLLQIGDILQGGDDRQRKDPGPEQQGLSDKYFDQLSLVQRLDLSDNDTLGQQFHLLQCAWDVASVIGAFPKWKQFRDPSAWDTYSALHCFVTHLEEGSEGRRTLMDDVASQKPNVEIRNIFAVHRQAEHIAFDRCASNVKYLYYGCNAEEVIGILSRGIVPPAAGPAQPQTRDGVQGCGITFTNSFRLSVKRSTPSRTTGSRMMFVARVALGNCSGNDTDPSDGGYDSIRLAPKDTETSGSFEEWEYEIRRPDQQKVAYLVEFACPGDAPPPAQPAKRPAIGRPSDEKCDWNYMVLPEDSSIATLSAPDMLQELLHAAASTTRNGETATRQPCGLRSVEGKASVPLKRVHIRGRLLDLVAKVVVFQEYVNDSQAALEAKYTFPLDDMAAVCGFEAFVNDKHVVGEVKEKQQAHREYSQAIKQGHGAYLMDEEEEQEMFSVRVGNIPPQARVIVKVTYVTELATEGHEVLFALHHSFLMPADEGSVRHGQDSKGPAAATEASDVSLELGIEMPYEIRGIRSPTSTILVKKTDTLATVKLVSMDREVTGRDFKLYVDVADIHVPRLWVERSQDERQAEACMLTFYPSFDVVGGDTESGVVTFLVDASNCMSTQGVTTTTRLSSGRSMTVLSDPPLLSAKAITLLALHHLDSKWRFNVVLFGSVCDELFPVPQEKTLANVGAAEEFLMKSRGHFGCSDLAVALRPFLLLPPECQDDAHNVFLVSNGHFHDAADTRLLPWIGDMAASRVRLFTFGVQADDKNPCNKHLLKVLAKRGAGAYEHFDQYLKSRWETKVKRQLSRASQPVLTDVRVEWQQLNAEDAAPNQAPRHLESIFHGTRQIIYGFLPQCTLVTLKAKFNGYDLSTVVSTSELAKTKGNMLHQLAARAIILDWKEGITDEDEARDMATKQSSESYIVELSKQFGVLCPLTSYLAIEKRDEDGPRRPRKDHSLLVETLLRDEAVDELGYIEYASDSQAATGRAATAEREDLSPHRAREMSERLESLISTWSPQRHHSLPRATYHSTQQHHSPLSAAPVTEYLMATCERASSSLFDKGEASSKPSEPMAKPKVVSYGSKNTEISERSYIPQATSVFSSAPPPTTLDRSEQESSDEDLHFGLFDDSPAYSVPPPAMAKPKKVSKMAKASERSYIPQVTSVCSSAPPPTTLDRSEQESSDQDMGFGLFDDSPAYNVPPPEEEPVEEEFVKIIRRKKKVLDRQNCLLPDFPKKGGGRSFTQQFGTLSAQSAGTSSYAPIPAMIAEKLSTAPSSSSEAFRVQQTDAAESGTGFQLAGFDPSVPPPPVYKGSLGAPVRSGTDGPPFVATAGPMGVGGPRSAGAPLASFLKGRVRHGFMDDDDEVGYCSLRTPPPPPPAPIQKIPAMIAEKRSTALSSSSEAIGVQQTDAAEPGTAFQLAGFDPSVPPGYKVRMLGAPVGTGTVGIKGLFFGGPLVPASAPPQPPPPAPILQGAARRHKIVKTGRMVHDGEVGSCSLRAPPPPPPPPPAPTQKELAVPKVVQRTSSFQVWTASPDCRHPAYNEPGRFADNELPQCSAIVEEILNTPHALLSNELLLLFKTGPGKRQQDLEYFTSAITVDNVRNLSDSAKDVEAFQNIWKYQSEGGHFSFGTFDKWKGSLFTSDITTVLEMAGLKSLGAAILDGVLELCATLAALFETLARLCPLPAYSQAEVPDTNPSALRHRLAEYFIDYARQTMTKASFVQVLKALAFVKWILGRHPLLYNNLELWKAGMGPNWESFIAHFLQKHISD